MLTLIIVISLFCNGLIVVTRERQLLFPLRTFIEDVILIRLGLPDAVAEWLYKPILGCIKCMASFWGIVISLCVLPLGWNLLWMLPVICIAASALNYLIYLQYEGILAEEGIVSKQPRRALYIIGQMVNQRYHEDDVFTDGKENYRLSYNEPTDEWNLLSCTSGYKSANPRLFETLLYVGVFEGNEHLFECD